MNAMAFISGGLPGGSEVLLILFIILLLFGAKKLPELSRSLGKSLGEFKKGKEDLDRELRGIKDDVLKEPVAPKQQTEESTPAEDDQPTSDSTTVL